MDLLEASAEARRAGRHEDAVALLNDALAAAARHGPTLTELRLHIWSSVS